MSRLIDVDALNSIKFHPLPYTHIVPDDVNAESYKRGWNDAVDAIIENAPTIEPERKTGRWVVTTDGMLACSNCLENPTNRIIINGNLVYDMTPIRKKMRFCPNCGVRMEGDN